jgi:hypothetical protein
LSALLCRLLCFAGAGAGADAGLLFALEEIQKRSDLFIFMFF